MASISAAAHSEERMRGSYALLHLAPARARPGDQCDKTSPLAPGDASFSFAKHQTEHTDSRDGEFEIRGFEGCFGELVVVTGAAYKFKEISRLHFNIPNLDAPYATFTDQLITRLISHGPQPNVKIELALHVTITGQGVTKVVVDSDKGPCSPA
jgi:hypothetical protein